VKLAVVIVTRNEEWHIDGCLESVFNALEPFSETPVVVVDSDSTDATVTIANRYPVTIYRYRGLHQCAAAGRRVGFDRVEAEYVLFLDGDCALHQEWLVPAVNVMDTHPHVAIVYGKRVEIFEGHSDTSSSGPSADEYHLGGNALYRADVLQLVGGFNPFILGDEEGELLGRIQAAGYRAIGTTAVMVTHYTIRKDSLKGFLHRKRRGFTRGVGQVLRLALSQGLFTYHVRRLNRYVLTLAFFITGVIAIAATGLRQSMIPGLLWLALGALAFCLLAIRRASVRQALYITLDWAIVAVDLLPGFLQPLRPSTSFKPEIDVVTPGFPRSV